ncbi:MAG: SDR family NAD(P)-dependent oxidoreductase [Chloroflexota bacterium]|nr:SDR family NAD(P)-dependent oxidoreductase [Chloroflexota bacterium]
MELGLKGKHVLVTGAGRGIGHSISLCLASEGACVAVVSRTDSDVESLVHQMGGQALGHQGVSMDLAVDEAPCELVEYLERLEFGPIDAVVHNLGGTLDITNPFCSKDDWRRVWRLNLEVAIELNLLLIPSMRERKWGRIVHISSISAMENHGPVPYCSVKAALTAYARSMGRVLAADGIIVTAVLPGAVFTKGGYWDVASEERPDHVQKYLAERMAINRFGRPDEVGNVVTFLCSEHASFCVGSVIPIDGGQGRGFFGL